MDKKQLEHELSAAKKENPNVTPFFLIALNLFDHRTPLTAVEFTLYCYNTMKETFPKLREMDNPEQEVQKHAEKYGTLKGIDVLQSWNDEVVVPVMNYIIEKKLRYQKLSQFKREQARFYPVLRKVVGEYLWLDKPLRGYDKLPDTVDYIGNTVFLKRVKNKLSDDELQQLTFSTVEQKPYHVRDSDEPIDDPQVRGYILKLLREHPMEKYDCYRVATCVRIDKGQASTNLELLLGTNESVIKVKPSSKSERASYKWCPEAHMIEARPKGKLQIISKALYRLLNHNSGTTASGARTLLRTYFGSMDSNVADQALDILKETGLVEIVPDKSHKQKRYCVVQKRSDDKDNALVRLATTKTKR